MTDQLPMQGPDKGECEGNRERCSLAKADRCPLFGTLLRESRDGGRRVRGCGDPTARGKRNKKKGSAKQAKAARAVGVQKTSMMPGHEEHFGGALRVEVKAGKQVGPILTRYLNAETQSEAARPIGDHRPFAHIAMPDGVSYGLVTIRTDQLEAAVTALAINLGIIEQGVR